MGPKPACPRALLLLSAWTGLANPLLGQEPAARVEPTPLASLTMPAGRPAEIAVELALLADRVTFPYVLKAKSTAQGLELTGRVPSSAIRDRALATARQAWGGVLTSQLIVVPNMAIAMPLEPDASFGHEARARLEKVAALAGRKLELRARKDGQLLLTGRADSEEQRLAFSQSLRGLPGAACVVNQMTVTPDAATSALPELRPPVEMLPKPRPAAAPTSAGPAPAEPPRLLPPTSTGALPRPGWGTPAIIIFED